MKSLMLLLQCVLADASTWCRTSTLRDWKTITKRSKHEGLSFLTITLPSFCRDFERSLDIRMVDHAAFLSFKKRGALPQFLGGLLDLVFDRSSGRLLDDPSKEAIYFIRQITLMFKKILLPCSSERNRRAFDGYVQCEREVAAWEENVAPELLARFDDVSSLLWPSDLSLIDRMVYEGDLQPKHGPGTTAERIVGNDKFAIRTWHSRLEDYFPSSEFVIPNSGFFDRLGRVDFAEPDAEMPVRVITVPKTLKTPRIIAIEPVCMQYAQQAVLDKLVVGLEESNLLQGSIGFTDQVPNQNLARLGSIDGSLATIDLSEASDRVSNLLVKRMLKLFPSLSGAVQACRTLRADVPGYETMSLHKFASMGSALCFPIEAMVFLTIILYAYGTMLNRSLTKKDVYVLLSKVRVYGDDIIVPTDMVLPVCDALDAFGMKVNRHKSFWTGKFRESCGKDYYDGSDVTVTYCRRLLPTKRGNSSEMASAVSLRNQLYKAGLWKSAAFLDDLIGRLAPFPNVDEKSPVLGRNSFLGVDTQRMCPNLHKPLVKGMQLRPVPRKSKLDDYGALLKFFLKKGPEPYFDPKHLERYGRPQSVDIKIGWASSR